MTKSCRTRLTKSRRRVLLVQTWWEDRVYRGVAAYAAEHNWELQGRMQWTRQLPAPGDWRGDGIIAFVGVSRLLRPESRKLVDFVRSSRMPVVETQAFADYFKAPKVVIPHETIGRVAADYFLALNFRALGFVTFDKNPLEESRCRGFQHAVEKGGAEFYALTPQTLRRRIHKLPRPMALFAVNDLNALDVIFTCLDAGFRIPEEFAVMGVDDTEIICDLAAVPLSSINCNYEQQGYEAAALLDRLMSGERKPVAPIIIPPLGVTVRRSTDTVSMPDLDSARMLRFIRDHFREPYTLQQMARETGVSLRKASDSFNLCLGRSMLQELTRLRVSQAKELLLDPLKKLEAVAVESGFSDRFHLGRAFRRVLGKTPSKWRRPLLMAKNKSSAQTPSRGEGRLGRVEKDDLPSLVRL